MKVTFIAAVLCLPFLLLGQSAHRFITVNGTAETVRSADQISIRFDVRTVDISQEKSKLANDKEVGSIFLISNRFEISNDDIKLSPLGFGKNYDYTHERKQKGYYTSQEFTVLLRDLSHYYDFMNALSEKNAVDIQHADYQISDFVSQNKAVMESALKAAREKAEYMVKAMGVKLGLVISIEEGEEWQSQTRNTNSFADSERKALSSVQAGKVEIKRSVRVTFEIL
jgi:hypothetical protein